MTKQLRAHGHMNRSVSRFSCKQVKSTVAGKPVFHEEYLEGTKVYCAFVHLVKHIHVPVE
jgi:hypothetical protein